MRWLRRSFWKTNAGGLHQFYFGTNRYALTPKQLSRIRFRNPQGLPTGDYPARLRHTGELVPAARPVLTVTYAGHNVRLEWSDGYTLQFATNILALLPICPSPVPPNTPQLDTKLTFACANDSEYRPRSKSTGGG